MMSNQNEMNRRRLILGAAGTLSWVLLAGCGGGSDSTLDENAVPVSNTHLYLTLMSLRFGLSPAEGIAAVGRVPDSTPSGLVQSWTEDGQTLTLIYRQYKNFTPQLDRAHWKWSPTSKTATYSFRKDDAPLFSIAT